MIQEPPERIEPIVPELLVAGEPAGGVLHGGRGQLAMHHPAELDTRDQPRRLQHRQVFHEPRQRHLVRLGQFADAAAALFAEGLQHLAPRGVGQRGKHQVEVVSLHHGAHFNKPQG